MYLGVYLFITGTIIVTAVVVYIVIGFVVTDTLLSILLFFLILLSLLLCHTIDDNCYTILLCCNHMHSASIKKTCACVFSLY